MSNKNIIGKKVHFGKYDWRILEWEFDKCLLVCEPPEGNENFLQPWDTSYRIDRGENIDWPDCELFDYLNEDFLEDSFTDEEIMCIIEDKFARNCYLTIDRSEYLTLFNFAESEHAFKKGRVTLLRREECEKYGLENNQPEWFCDDYFMREDECLPLHYCYIRPVIWIDFYMIDAFFPKWRVTAEFP